MEARRPNIDTAFHNDGVAYPFQSLGCFLQSGFDQKKQAIWRKQLCQSGDIISCLFGVHHQLVRGEAAYNQVPQTVPQPGEIGDILLHSLPAQFR